MSRPTESGEDFRLCVWSDCSIVLVTSAWWASGGLWCASGCAGGLTSKYRWPHQVTLVYKVLRGSCVNMFITRLSLILPFRIITSFCTIVLCWSFHCSYMSTILLNLNQRLWFCNVIGHDSIMDFWSSLLDSRYLHSKLHSSSDMKLQLLCVQCT